MCNGVCYNITAANNVRIRVAGGAAPTDLNMTRPAVGQLGRELREARAAEAHSSMGIIASALCTVYRVLSLNLASYPAFKTLETWPVKSWLPREPLGLKPETRPTETWSKSGWQDADLNHGAFGSYRRTEQSRRVSRYGCILT